MYMAIFQHHHHHHHHLLHVSFFYTITVIIPPALGKFVYSLSIYVCIYMSKTMRPVVRMRHSSKIWAGMGIFRCARMTDKSRFQSRMCSPVQTCVHFVIYSPIITLYPKATFVLSMLQKLNPLGAEPGHHEIVRCISAEMSQ